MCGEQQERELELGLGILEYLWMSSPLELLAGPPL